MTANAGLVVTFHPLKTLFVLGEPIVVEMVISNVSSSEIVLPLDYPRDLGISFACDNLEPRASDAYADGSTDKRIPIRTLLPRQAAKHVIVLNRYFKFYDAGSYHIKYTTELYESVRSQHTKPRTFTASGSFRIIVKKGSISEADIDVLIGGTDSGDVVEVREAIEQLLWIDNPAVVVALANAAERAPEMCTDIILALEKFSKSPEGRSALIKTVKVGGPTDLRVFLMVAMRRSLGLMEQEYAQLLHSKDTGKQYVVLEHISKTQDRDVQRRLAKLIQGDASHELRTLVNDILKGE